MLNRLTTARACGALLLVASLWAAPACNDTDGGASGETVAQLTKDLNAAQRVNKQMAERIDRLERKMDGFRQDVDRLGRERHAEALDDQDAATATAAEEPAQAAASAMGGAGLTAVLESDEGQAAVAKAMQAIQEKRDGERRQRMVSGLVDRFAQEANLSEAQTVDVFRDAGDLSAEGRASLRDENMAKMEDIRTATDDEMKAVLNADQFSIYEEQAQRMRGFGGRGRSGGGSRR